MPKFEFRASETIYYETVEIEAVDKDEAVEKFMDYRDTQDLEPNEYDDFDYDVEKLDDEPNSINERMDHA